MEKKQNKRDQALQDLADCFSRSCIENIDELIAKDSEWVELSQRNREILDNNPKLYESIIKDGKTAPLTSEEHDALREVLNNQFNLFMKSQLAMFINSFDDCLCFLKIAGVIRASYMDKGLMDICAKHPNALRELFE